jgi:hypothetical protein
MRRGATLLLRLRSVRYKFDDIRKSANAMMHETGRLPFIMIGFLLMMSSDLSPSFVANDMCVYEVHGKRFKWHTLAIYTNFQATRLRLCGTLTNEIMNKRVD